METKHLLIPLTALALFASCSNEPIPEKGLSPPTALDPKANALIAKAVEAKNFFYPKNSRSTSTDASVDYIVKQGSRSEADTVLSVVNFADNQGFVILTDKKDSPDIIAVSDKGNIDINNIDNPSLKLFVDNAAEALAGKPVKPNDTIIENPMDLRMYEDVITRDTIYNIEPMISVMWGQGSPYNRFCPIIGNFRTYTGCGPIAVAQVMTHYRYPNSFVWDLDGTTTTIPLDWTMINKHVTSGVGVLPGECNDDTATHNVIGKLVRKIGQVMGVNYTADGTSTYLTEIRRTLSHYGYNATYIPTKPNPEKINFDGSSIWILGGNSNQAGRDSGHAFIVDGRKYIRYHQEGHIIDPNIIPPQVIEIVNVSTTYFDYIHINWGWDGLANGYYYNGSYNSADPYEYDAPEYGVGYYNYTSNFDYVIVKR